MNLLGITFRKILIFILALLVIIPIIMVFLWFFTPGRNLNILIIDKTSPTSKGQERASLFWSLNYNKYQNFGKPLSPNNDYYGYSPSKENGDTIRAVSSLSSQEITSLAKTYNCLYIADTYGIYNYSAIKNRNEPGRDKLVYGGLNRSDYELIQKMDDNNKTIILEFNSIAPPTKTKIRNNICDKFNLHWRGWRGRYISTLDSSQTTLSDEIIAKYLEDNNNWPFQNSGIVFVHDTGKVVILEDKKDLKMPLPILRTGEYGQQKFNLPEKIHYARWFNVIGTGLSNKIVSEFSIETTQTGKILLQNNNIPENFPAILQSQKPPYFYYFAGNFTNNISKAMIVSYFRGIHIFSPAFYNKNKIGDSRKFFWEFYLPLTTEIFKVSYRWNKF